MHHDFRARDTPAVRQFLMRAFKEAEASPDEIPSIDIHCSASKTVPRPRFFGVFGRIPPPALPPQDRLDPIGYALEPTISRHRAAEAPLTVLPSNPT